MQESEKLVRNELEKVKSMLNSITKLAMVYNIPLDAELIGWYANQNDFDKNTQTMQAKDVATANAQAAHNSEALRQFQVRNQKPVTAGKPKVNQHHVTMSQEQYNASMTYNSRRNEPEYLETLNKRN